MVIKFINLSVIHAIGSISIITLKLLLLLIIFIIVEIVMIFALLTDKEKGPRMENYELDYDFVDE